MWKGPIFRTLMIMSSRCKLPLGGADKDWCFNAEYHSK